MVVEVLCVCRLPWAEAVSERPGQQCSEGSTSVQLRCAPTDGVREAGMRFGCAETHHAAGSPRTVREERVVPLHAIVCHHVSPSRVVVCLSPSPGLGARSLSGCHPHAQIRATSVHLCVLPKHLSGEWLQGSCPSSRGRVLTAGSIPQPAARSH